MSTSFRSSIQTFTSSVSNVEWKLDGRRPSPSMFHGRLVKARACITGNTDLKRHGEREMHAARKRAHRTQERSKTSKRPTAASRPMTLRNQGIEARAQRDWEAGSSMHDGIFPPMVNYVDRQRPPEATDPEVYKAPWLHFRQPRLPTWHEGVPHKWTGIWTADPQRQRREVNVLARRQNVREVRGQTTTQENRALHVALPPLRERPANLLDAEFSDELPLMWDR